MKKTMILVVVICFTSASAMPSFADRFTPRHRAAYRSNIDYRVANYQRVIRYTVDHDRDWKPAVIAFGIGALAGVALGNMCSSQPAPPTPVRSSYAYAPQVVVNPAPVAVVTEPAEKVRPPVTSGTVFVTASILNVRSGPGMEHAIIDQVYEGEVLFAQRNSSGWLYVSLPEGGSGWVRADYISPAASARG
jgi:uncharacterized protein YgiM (DUF1202 family)